VAASFASAGFQVVGVDVQAQRVDTINAGQNPIAGEEPGLAELLAETVAAGRLRASVDYGDLAQADVILIDVQTPVDDDHIPRYEALRAASHSLAPVLKPGALVVVESTVSPGTTRNVVAPLLERGSDGRLNHDFYLGACPERVMPGKLLHNLRHMSRVCGGCTPETAQTMIRLYRHVVAADLDPADATTAELVKTTENAYRDVQIAFANEVALICEAVGADVWRVRELVNKVPSRQMHLPGAGVGGHCIPKDPWLLAHGAGRQTPVRLIPQARAVNEGMPAHMADLVARGLTAAGVPLAEARVLVLGYAYLENSDDTRHSPSAALLAHLEEKGIAAAVHDPWVPAYQGDLLARAADCHAAALMVAHRHYHDLDLAALKQALRAPVLVDGRHVFDRQAARQAGFIFYGVGQG
ncbi:MAG: nucleotide sugar dehydrogenase, partial [Candidatus Promineifilaceae bacterium]|nr:nucleotide sugar dehydrogenase [Candidatus Promineifilaceae bacterium]